MTGDSSFQIGKTHQVCEDYAVAGTSDDSTYVIVADGCSSSPDTDLGARFLVKSAQKILRETFTKGQEVDWEAYAQEAVKEAAACVSRLDIAPACLDATLLTLIAQDGKFTLSVFGDGVVVLGRQDGRLEVRAISYAASYPRYPSYGLDADRAARWQSQSGNEKQIQWWTLGPDVVKDECVTPSDRVFESWSGTQETYRFAALLSDGVQSFTAAHLTETSRTVRPISLPEVLPPLLDFKTFSGAFVQRRLQAFAKDCGKRGWQHSDDLSLAAVWLG